MADTMYNGKQASVVAPEEMKRDAELQEIHELLERAVNAGREAAAARKSAQETLDHAKKVESEAMNFWNMYHEKLMEYTHSLPGFAFSELGKLFNPPKMVKED